MSPDHFHTTRWTRVLAARGNSPEARQALSDLCALNYAPVLRFLRAAGHPPDEAQDLAHGFFAQVLAHHSLDGADRGRGRFRSYLLGALKHFASAQRQRDARLKRGAGLERESLDTDTAAGVATVPEALRTEPPDAVFDREWALAIIDRAVTALGVESAASGSSAVFEALKPCLSTSTTTPLHAETAEGLGMSEGALRVALHRLRKRFRELVRGAVLETVQDETELEGEMQHLIKALAE